MATTDSNDFGKMRAWAEEVRAKHESAADEDRPPPRTHDPSVTPEQRARELLDRMDMPGALDMTAGDVVELANLIAERDHLRRLHDAAADANEDMADHPPTGLAGGPPIDRAADAMKMPVFTSDAFTVTVTNPSTVAGALRQFADTIDRGDMRVERGGVRIDGGAGTRTIISDLVLRFINDEAQRGRC